MTTDGSTQFQRVDLWLWHARLAPTRTRASALVREGRVRINRIKARRASARVRTGDVLTFAGPGAVRVLRIEAISDRRLGAPAASELYTDIGASGFAHG